MINKIKPKYFTKYLLTCVFLGVVLNVGAESAKAYTDTKTGSVEAKESFQIPDLFKKGGETLIDWSIERTSKFYGWTPANVGGSVTVDGNGNVVSLNSDTSNEKYYLTSKGLEGSWAVGGTGDFGHILSYSELNNICQSGKDFNSVSDHKNWPDEGAHVMVCTVYDKFKTVGCGFDCSHKNNYEYSFDYQIKKSDTWASIDDANVNKCEDMKVIFTPKAEWFANLTHSCTETSGKNVRLERRIDLLSPATVFASCSDQDSCLNQAQESNLTTGTYARGIQKVPANFVANTQNSLNGGDDATLKCTSGDCVAYSSGKRTLSVTAPESQYYGQCRADVNSENVSGDTVATPLVKISPPAVSIPATTSSVDLNVINRAPLASLSLDKTNIEVGGEITATCDISDPDTCSDKIVNVKWTCYNSKNEQTNCYFNKDGIWKEGELSKDVPDSEQNYQYRSIVKWKAGTQGVYAIACEGTDNDETASATGKTVVPIVVGPPTCDADGYCNLNCPYDPDCCGDPSYNISHSSQCVVSAGSCIVTRTKPGIDITLVQPLDKVEFQANVFGGSKPTGYTWYCDKNDNNLSSTNSSLRTDSHICKYSVPGKTYEPKAVYSYKDEKGNTQSQECTNSQGVGVKVNGELGADSCTCNVLARPYDSTDPDDYVSNVKISAGDKVDVKITKNCTKKDATVWTTDGKEVGTKTNTKNLIQYDQAGIGYIKANIGSTVCTGASVDIKDKVKMGNN